MSSDANEKGLLAGSNVSSRTSVNPHFDPGDLTADLSPPPSVRDHSGLQLAMFTGQNMLAKLFFAEVL